MKENKFKAPQELPPEEVQKIQAELEAAEKGDFEYRISVPENIMPFDVAPRIKKDADDAIMKRIVEEDEKRKRLERENKELLEEESSLGEPYDPNTRAD